MSKWGWRNQHCPLGSKYAHGCMCILILTLCTYSMRERYQKRMDVAQKLNFLCQVLTRTKKTTCMPAQMHWPTCKDLDHELKRTRVIPLLETAENQAHQRNIQVYRYTRGHSVEVRVFFSKIQWLIQTTVHPRAQYTKHFVRRVLSLIPIFVFCQLQQKHVS